MKRVKWGSVAFWAAYFCVMLALSAEAQGSFWVLVNGALRSNRPIVITGGATPIDVQIAGSSVFSVSSTGRITTADDVFSSGANGFRAAAGSFFYWNTRALMASPSDGAVTVSNAAQTIGVRLKADALPTVSSGFGTSPAITAGSTPMAGSINVGTGGVAVTGVINFNGTAYTAAPFCTVSDQTSNVTTRWLSSTTQLTLTTTVAWGASDVVSWICISSR